MQNLTEKLTESNIALAEAEGLAKALERDKEIETGKVVPIDHSEFRRLTGGAGNED